MRTDALERPWEAADTVAGVLIANRKNLHEVISDQDGIASLELAVRIVAALREEEFLVKS
jgi:hypothetical protein